MELRHNTANSSTSVRTELIKQGIHTLRENYGIGIGGGNMTERLKAMGGVGNAHITALHNFWLELAVEGGILYVLAFAIWYGSVLYQLYKAQKKTANQSLPLPYWIRATTVVWLCFPVGAVALSSCIYFLPMYLLFGWTLALLTLESE